MNDPLIQETIVFVKKRLENIESGHDWFHIERVYRNAMKIAETEEVDQMVVALAALLHDIADSKFHGGDETIGPRIAREFLATRTQDEQLIDHVVQIIKNISFRGGNVAVDFKSKEFDVVRDADRLDAMGAIGIARTFNYGGFKNRKIYDPEIPPAPDQTPEAYKSSQSPTINHFYEKLLLLKDLMTTSTGKKMAEERHRFMEDFLEQFYREWEGER